MVERKVDFKFGIGDMVMMKGMTVVGKLYNQCYPQKGIVVSLLAEFCPGGVQSHYAVRWMARGMGQWAIVEKILRHNEEELVPWKEEFDKQES